MRKLILSLAATTLAGFAVSPAAASTVVDGKCVNVAIAQGGCLFSGNINDNPNAGNVNSYKNAEAAYNLYNTRIRRPIRTLR